MISARTAQLIEQRGLRGEQLAGDNPRRKQKLKRHPDLSPFVFSRRRAGVSISRAPLVASMASPDPRLALPRKNPPWS
jgi:hypothetical protein